MSDDAAVAPAENNVSTPAEVSEKIIFIRPPFVSLKRLNEAGVSPNTAEQASFLNSRFVSWRVDRPLFAHSSQVRS